MVKRTNDSKYPETSENGAGKPKSVLERLSNGIEELSARQSRLETLLTEIREAVGTTSPRKEYYTTAEAAAILGRAVFTVRQWARLGRINAEKTHAGRGIDAEWRISKQELERIRNFGLLPIVRRF
jgi:excisionase family DNA binding protein